MAKKKSDDASLGHVIILIIPIVLATIAILGYAAILFFPPFFLCIGFINNHIRALFLKKAKSLKDFDLDIEERLRLEKTKDNFLKLKNDLENQYYRGRSLSKRKDGMFNEKSKLGKELNIIIPDLEHKKLSAEQEYNEIESRPRKRLNYWLRIKSKRLAYSISLFIYIGVVLWLLQNNYKLMNDILYYVAVIPKAISDISLGFVMMVFENANQWWIFKAYEIYPNYHAPMVSAAIISYFIFLILGGTYKACLRTRLEITAEKGSGTQVEEDQVMSERATKTIKNDQFGETEPLSKIIRCPSCGAKNRIPDEHINESSKCGKCSAVLPASEEEDSSINTPEMHSSNKQSIHANNGLESNTIYISPQSKEVVFILAFLLGWLGIHRFYVGKWLTGILYLLTIGLLGIGLLLDLILILANKFSDKQKRLIMSERKYQKLKIGGASVIKTSL